MGFFLGSSSRTSTISDFFSNVLCIPVASVVGTEAKSLMCTTRVADELFKEMNTLRDKKFDIENRLLEVGRTYQMIRWIEKVERIDREVTRFEITYNGRIPCYHSCTCWPNYKLGKEAVSKLGRVLELIREKKELDPQINQQPPDVVKIEPERTPETIVGRENVMGMVMFQLRRIEGQNVIGIEGVDGIGKTKLLQKIKNSFNGTDFDVIIDVIIGENPSISRIQEDVGVQLGYSRRTEQTRHHCYRRSHRLLPADETDAAMELSGVLEKKKFLLLLDDVNEILDLELMGIPPPKQGNSCKIVLATKSMEVCEAMRVYTIRMDHLSEFDSWSLFCNHLAEAVDMRNQSIRRHVKETVNRCNGLPLSLIAVAKCVTSPAVEGEWREVKKKLKKAADCVKLDGLISLYSALQVEFDGLETKLRECLFYCSIFPENHQISLEKLVDYWVGEGLLRNEQMNDDEEEVEDIYTERDQGIVFVTRLLQSASLLEEVSVDGRRRKVKMHSSVRKLTLHLSNDLFLVQAGSGLQTINGVERWAMAKRVSFMYNHIAEVPELQNSCPDLSTLMINNNIGMTRVPSDLFEFTPALRVLDMSNTSLREIPAAIGSLAQLRYLNLSFTYVESLPEELGQLKKLRQLDLSLTFALDDIPREAVLGMESLQSLDLSGSEYKWGMEQHNRTDRNQLTLDGLEKLTRLGELGLKIREPDTFRDLMKSDRPLKSTRFLELEVSERLNSGDLSVAFERMSELKELNISKLEKLEELRFTAYAKVVKLEVLTLAELPLERINSCSSELFQSLGHLEVKYCHNMKDLSWVRNLPSLENLTVSHCHQLECIVLDSTSESEAEIQPVDDRDEYFPKLQKMILSNLPKLRYISEELLSFPLLKMLVVDECLELKELPFDRNGCKMLKHVHGNREWWDGLNWRHPLLRYKLSPVFSNPWF